MSVYAPTLDRGFSSAPRAQQAIRKHIPLTITGGDGPNAAVETRQMESPLNALICRREQMYLDEVPSIQLESPLNALVSCHQQVSLDRGQAHQLENPLAAQINERKQQQLNKLPNPSESPLVALINGHGEQG
jgi:hypothetical protein